MRGLNRAKRLTDTVACWGGEEFLAVLPVPNTGAHSFCERVRRDISELSKRRSVDRHGTPA